MNLQRLFQNEPNTETFASGQTIFQEGERAENMYVVLDGQVDVVYDGRVIETLEPGGVLGELALIDKSTRSATAVAKTDSRVARIDQKRFTFLVQQHPYFAIHIMGVMAERLRRQTA